MEIESLIHNLKVEAMEKAIAQSAPAINEITELISAEKLVNMSVSSAPVISTSLFFYTMKRKGETLLSSFSFLI